MMPPVMGGDVTLRPFGLYESDLNIDFIQTQRPFLVTEILDCCAKDTSREIAPEFFWNLTVGKRIECLLKLAAADAGTAIPFTFLCPNDGCSQELEIEIDVAEIADLQAEAYKLERVPVEFENRSMALRRPTASDQLGWLKCNFPDQQMATKAMVRTLLVEPVAAIEADVQAIPDELIPIVQAAMEEHDPLINFNLLVRCFSCDEENRIEIDMEEFSLRRLQQAQLRLLATVHRLASHYHWSEQEIFSVPYWRRARYLSLIEK